MPSSIVASFLGALQASLSVLLTISYGVVGTQLDFLNGPTAKRMSKLSVKIFLPALLFVNVGSQLDAESWPRYVPVLIWAIVYNLISILIGLVLTRLLKLPAWATPAMTFQNASAMPLLLVQSLETTGILDNLLPAGDSSSLAVARAKSYLLVNSMIANSFTFGIGPRLLGVYKDRPKLVVQPSTPPESPSTPPESPTGYEEFPRNYDGFEEEEPPKNQHDPEDLLQPPSDNEASAHLLADEQTSLLPKRVVRKQHRTRRSINRRARRTWRSLPHRLRSTLSFLHELVSGPLVAGSLGAVIGLIPTLHRAFFAPGNAGGVLNGWLTNSLRNIGELFPPLQVVLVGVKLSKALLAMKHGDGGEGSRVPWPAMLTVTFVRFFLWPILSIPAIWALATRTSFLSADPILWFAMMLMPIGPPALKLTSLAEVAGVDEEESLGIAKFLTLSYAICPLICVGCVGALKASEAAMATM